mgnify:CR=1 FL=1
MRKLFTEAAFNNNYLGSSTCVMLRLDPVQKVVETLNMGDCQYLILRKTGMEITLLHRSEAQ